MPKYDLKKIEGPLIEYKLEIKKQIGEDDDDIEKARKSFIMYHHIINFFLLLIATLMVAYAPFILKDQSIFVYNVSLYSSTIIVVVMMIYLYKIIQSVHNYVLLGLSFFSFSFLSCLLIVIASGNNKPPQYQFVEFFLYISLFVVLLHVKLLDVPIIVAIKNIKKVSWVRILKGFSIFTVAFAGFALTLFQIIQIISTLYGK